MLNRLHGHRRSLPADYQRLLLPRPPTAMQTGRCFLHRSHEQRPFTASARNFQGTEEASAEHCVEQQHAKPRSNGAQSNGAGLLKPERLPEASSSYWQQVAAEVRDPESIKVVSVEFMAQVRPW
jgi:hypothetical protein